MNLTDDQIRDAERLTLYFLGRFGVIDSVARDEMCQQVVVWLLSQAEGRCPLSTRVFRLVQRALANANRCRRRSRALGPDDVSGAREERTGPTREEMLSLLRRARLTRKQREVCEMMLDGLTRREAADRLGITKQAVSVRLQHAFVKLRPHAEEMFGPS